MADTEEAPDEASARREDSEAEGVEAGVTGLYDAALYFESKQRILDLLRVFAEHGYLNLEEVAAALGRTSELATSGDMAALRMRVRDLEDRVRGERLANELAAWELEESRSALAEERELVQESLVRIARLEEQLRDARRTAVKLIAASKNGLATLKSVRERLASETYAAGALAPLVHDFRELTQVVQELHVLAAVKGEAVPLQPEPH